MGRLLPGAGEPVRSLRCLYTLTPDRDFVVSPVPGHAPSWSGSGSAHGFKFAPTFGRLLADLAVDGEDDADISAFGFDRPALTDPGYEVALDGVTCCSRCAQTSWLGSIPSRVPRSRAPSGELALGQVAGTITWHGKPVEQRRQPPGGTSGSSQWKHPSATPARIAPASTSFHRTSSARLAVRMSCDHSDSAQASTQIAQPGAFPCGE